jgi:predicted acylesterase/phospholipase RssA
MKIQVAVQGGGARLVALLAAMQALQNLEKLGTVQVTRMAGTSAGAIASVLFAARVPIAEARQALFARREELVRTWKLPSAWSGAIGVARGKPLWSNAALIDVLKKLLIKHGRSSAGGPLDQNVRLEDLAVPVLALATNLNTLRAEVHREGDGVLSSVANSAALPFLFRAVKSSPSSPVDGGICDNLPASHLLAEEARFGPTIGISFFPDRPTEGPSGVLEYAMAIVNTAINHSAERSRQQLGPGCLLMATDIQTFEFDKAFSKGLGPQFEEIVQSTQESLVRTIRVVSGSSRDAAKNSPPTEFTDEDWKPAPNAAALGKRYSTALVAIGQMYRQQHHHQKIKYLMGRLVIVANGLGLSAVQQRDQITSTSVITTSRDPVYCHRAALGQSGLPDTILDDSEVTVSDNNGNEVNTISIPMDFAGDALVREVLLCFDPLLTPTTGPYTLRCKSTFSDFLKPLRDTGQDQLGLILTRAESDIPIVEIILMYPRSFGKIAVVESSCEYLAIPSPELAAYGDGVPPDYAILGWRAHNVPSFLLKIAKAKADP